jgi:hypothetical protein
MTKSDLDITAECKRIVVRGTKPTLPEVRPIIEAWYARPENGAGGELHVILDDNNMERSFLVHTIASDRHGDEAKWICNVLLMLTPSQKRRL